MLKQVQHDGCGYDGKQTSVPPPFCVGMGRWREEQVGEALLARDRQELGLNAPPHGLYFVHATYPGEENEE